jgi:hypothetical protein
MNYKDLNENYSSIAHLFRILSNEKKNEYLDKLLTAYQKEELILDLDNFEKICTDLETNMLMRFIQKAIQIRIGQRSLNDIIGDSDYIFYRLKQARRGGGSIEHLDLLPSENELKEIGKKHGFSFESFGGGIFPVFKKDEFEYRVEMYLTDNEIGIGKITRIADDLKNDILHAIKKKAENHMGKRILLVTGELKIII